MSPEDTLDISGTIDQKLASWPAPTRDDAAWGARAEAILAAAQASPRASDATITSLLEPPRLDPEPGEPGSTNIAAPVRAAGEKQMSQESNPGGGAPSNPGAGPLSAATPSKRPSLKELAARASQTGAARQSMPGASTPPPATSKPVSEPPAAKPSIRPSAPSIRPSAPSAPPRISDHEHDSGVIDLNKVNSAATPQQIAAAEKAQPAAHDLVGDDDKGEAAAPAKEAAKVASLADAREKKKEGGNGGTIAGVVIALVAMAAGGVFWMRNHGGTPTNTTAQSGKENPPAAVQAPVPAEPQKVAEAKPEEPKGLSIDSLPPAEEEAQKRAAAHPAGGGAADGQKLAAAQPAPTAAPAAPAGTGTAPPIGDKPGDLSSAMAKAVGDSGEKAVDTEGATPANGGKAGNQSVPEKPSQGSVNSAIGSVMGGAKACVAGADDVSRAQITFGSNGSVQNVSVTGWAASNNQSGCVKAALKGASVGPFSQPTFTVGVTIRP